MNYSANWNYPTNVKVGAGRIKELPGLCKSMGMQSPLLITDPGLAALPMLNAVVDDLNQSGLNCGLFSGIKANPTGENVDDGTAYYRQHSHDGVISGQYGIFYQSNITADGGGIENHTDQPQQKYPDG